MKVYKRLQGENKNMYITDENLIKSGMESWRSYSEAGRGESAAAVLTAEAPSLKREPCGSQASVS